MIVRNVISELVCEHCGVHFVAEYKNTDTETTCLRYCGKQTKVIVVQNQYKDMCDWCPEIEGYVAYIIQCKNGDLYKGHTNDFKRRMMEHFNLVGCRTTKDAKPEYILHYESFETRKEAVVREKYFKTHLYWIRNNRETFTPIYPS